MNYLKTAGQIMIAAAALALASSADAAEKKTIGMVFKVLNNAFTPPLQQGCAQAAKDLNVDCIFVGPTEYNEAQEVQMVQDMIQRGVDGLAVSAANPKAMARILKQAQEKHIPVVMFDSDVLPEDKDVRLTFIGTDNYSFGSELAKAVLKTKKGGSVCIQSGAAASLNLNDRVQGIRDTLAGAAKDQPVKRLTGQNGWTEPDGCPVYNNDDIKLAAQQVNDVFTAQPKLDAFIAVGGWAQYAPEAYKQAVALQKDRRSVEGSCHLVRRQFSAADAPFEGRTEPLQHWSAAIRYGLYGREIAHGRLGWQNAAAFDRDGRGDLHPRYR